MTDDVYEDYEDYDEAGVDGRDIDPGSLSCEEALKAAIETIDLARSIPMSSSVVLNRDALLGLLEHALDSLPQELRGAQWLLKEGDQVRERAERDAERIVEEAAAQAAHLVDRQEIVRKSKIEAARITDAARDEANNYKRGAEDFCDKELATFDIELDKLSNLLDRLKVQVAGGRTKLRDTGVEFENGLLVDVFEDDEDSGASAYFERGAD
ncbi:MAG: hypothetical protein R2698_10745 [Microthrixaceae bacterium]